MVCLFGKDYRESRSLAYHDNKELLEDAYHKIQVLEPSSNVKKYSEADI